MQKKTQQHYQKLCALGRRTHVLQGVNSILEWDQETYMPAGASQIRAEQLQTMAGVIHKERTSLKFKRALSKLIDIDSGTLLATDLTSLQMAAVKEMRRDFLKCIALPSAFVEEFARTSSEAIVIWRKAKEENRFQDFLPIFERIISLCQRKADFLGYKDHPYDALLDEYEPDLTTIEVSSLFTNLRNALLPLITKNLHNIIDDQFLFGEWEGSKQMIFAQHILNAMGYDALHGRIDFSSHPFSSACHPTDSRITTRLHSNSLMSNIFIILHEAGHALYEMGLPVEHYGTPLCEARSLGIHESQSRWWETHIGLSLPFWKYFFPRLQQIFAIQLSHISLEQFHRAIHKVHSSLIRVEADELTYPLHIILRFELEKALIEGSLHARDVPHCWNEKMQQYLKITPPDDQHGCLQDIHWSMGAFGYFPTYSLGNLYAAHLFETFAKQHHDWETLVSQGKLAFIREWLQKCVYQHGRAFTTHDLLFAATSTPFSELPYLKYLNKKYAT